MSRKKFKQIKDKYRKRRSGKTPNASLRSAGGQALIEFVLGLMIVIGFFFFYVKMAGVFAIGNFIHYATFMAARAYSSSTDTQDQQRINGETVLQKMVGGRYKTLLKAKGGTGSIPGANIGDGPYYAEDPAEDNWNQGVTYSYEANVSLYPWSRGGGAIKMELTSESWLRREETEAEARSTLAKIQQKVTLPGVKVEWDNGW